MIKEDFEDNYFWIELIRPDGKRVQVKYAKAREKFDDDYAVVRAFYPHDGWGNYTFYGIVDKKFRTVIPFKMWKNVEYISDNQYLVRDIDNLRNYTYHIDLNTKKCVSMFGGYKKINDHLLIVEMNNYPNNYEMLKGLYDMRDQKVISNFFHEIHDFEIVHGKKVAFAKRKILKDIKKYPYQNVYPMEALCYIDEYGDIVSPVYYSFHDDYLKTSHEEYLSLSKDNFEQFIENEECNILKHSKYDKVRERLKSKI